MATSLAAPPSWYDALRDPVDGTPLAEGACENELLVFAGGRRYPCAGGTPILFDETTSLFRAADVLRGRPTTQDRGYTDPDSWKTRIRRHFLPALTEDRGAERRYRALAERVRGRTVLILGAGELGEWYRRLFPSSEVVTSDVHLQYGVDLVLDAHRIPFRDGYFGLVLAAQVLEHTARPWLVADEMQRVTERGGYIQVEIPFGFPLHAMPYDFYRFTPSALRLLFPRAAVTEFSVPEGPGAAFAAFGAYGLIEIFERRRLRQAAVVASRLLFGWPKYLDRLRAKRRQGAGAAKGYAVTYQVDGRARSDAELLQDVRGFVA